MGESEDLQAMNPNDRACIHRLAYTAVANRGGGYYSWYWRGLCVLDGCNFVQILDRQAFRSIHPSFARRDDELKKWLKAGGRGQPPVALIGTPNQRQPARPRARRIA